MAEQITHEAEAVPAVADLRKYIDTNTYMERPHIRGRRVPVATIAYCARDPGWNVAELVYNFSLSEAQVLAALLYYEEHTELIDRQEAAYQAELDEAYRLYGESGNLTPQPPLHSSRIKLRAG